MITDDEFIPAELRAVLDLFATELAKVTFPDCDAATLRRQVDELRTEHKAVARAQQALEAAEAALTTRTAALMQASTRAIAYARIYADAHPERTALATAVAALEAPVATAPMPKKRGRPRKHAAAELFAVPATADAR